ncbi:hypothetical protein M0805_006427 [Coniferiporia weirii]|nr:hypothetical protein M0805_006427 [Coniferiporia weirii]
MRSIKDPVHDFITFSPLIWAFIDTRQFQRLRSIKQLGVSYYVWAGASHNRFEHCIGVAHLAGMLVERLRTIQPELGITERDVRCVQLAGLCHDLGHGPWSHVWDGFFIPAVLPDQKWTHEDASEMMFDDLVRQNEIEIDLDDINFIKDLIKGTKCRNPPEKKFLFDIVANKRNGIDVDKFDYIARDVRAIGDHNNFSARRLIDSARVINDEICYHIKDANSVYEVCTLRFSNHKRIYSHKTARAIEYMIIDALKLAEPVMAIAERILDPRKYLHLTDNVMERIEMSDDPALAESRSIFDRLRTRDLYRCVDWKTFPWELRDSLRSTITPERIVSTAKTLFENADPAEDGPSQELVASLTKEHVIVDISMLHHGMKERNPIDFVRFYGKHNTHESFKAEPGELSTLMPACFAEMLLRIYTKVPLYYGVIQAGYRELLQSLPSGDPMTSSQSYVSDSTTPPITEAPSTPRAASVQPCSRNVSYSMPGSAKTPFAAQNKFTKVSHSFVPPSPTQSHRRVLSRTPSLATMTQGSFSSAYSAQGPLASGGMANRGQIADEHAVATDTEEPAGARTPRRAAAPALEPALNLRVTRSARRKRGTNEDAQDEADGILVKKRKQ